MSDIFEEAASFRSYQSKLGRDGRASAATATLTTKIRIFVPATNSPELRWELTLFALDVIRSPSAAESMKVGAAFTLISMYSERPGALIRSLLNDPDIEAVIIDVGSMVNGIPVMERRGDKAQEEMEGLMRILKTARDSSKGKTPFVDSRAYGLRITDMSTLVSAVITIEAQIWILIAKAVTAPDTAEESETRRWAKYVQQKRVNPFFALTQQWLTEMRNLLSQSLSVRKFMVEILIEVKKGGSAKGRAVEIISDIGNYVEETGMAGFFATIRFGLETRYPALALNEFQSDLNTIKSLMLLYREIGPRAPYMVLLEESIQTKFAPGGYPLLWSFAMGVATTIDRSMGALNINRGYLEPMYFRLGQKSARHHAGGIDQNMANRLGLSSNQVAELAAAVQETSAGRQESNVQAREAKFAAGGVLIGGSDQDVDEEEEPIEQSGRQSVTFKREMSISSLADSVPSSSVSTSGGTRSTNSLLNLRSRLAAKAAKEAASSNATDDPAINNRDQRESEKKNNQDLKSTQNDLDFVRADV
nr:nucleocapsid protein [Henipavirus nipahense]QCY54423.1 nucleocapsid protein [Henipavirus nipahense]